MSHSWATPKMKRVKLAGFHLKLIKYVYIFHIVDISVFTLIVKFSTVKHHILEKLSVET